MNSFPRHIHFGSEDNVIEDHVLEENVSPEGNFRRFMEWVRGLLRN